MLQYFYICFYSFKNEKKKKMFLNIFSIDLILFLVKAPLISQEVFRDYQINLENTANLNSSL